MNFDSQIIKCITVYGWGFYLTVMINIDWQTINCFMWLFFIIYIYNI